MSQQITVKSRKRKGQESSSKSLVTSSTSIQPSVPFYVQKYKLTTADNVTPEDDREDQDNPFKFAFYTTSNTYLIPYRMRIRLAYNEFDGAYNYYFCRWGDLRGKSKEERNSTDKLSVIQLTLFQGARLANVLGKFLKSYDEHEKMGEESLQRISFFDQGKDRAYDWVSKDWGTYFAMPDAEISPTILIRFGHNKITKRYTCYLFNEVPDDKKRESWRGPLFAISLGSMRTLYGYFRMTQEEFLKTQVMPVYPPIADGIKREPLGDDKENQKMGINLVKKKEEEADPRKKKKTKLVMDDPILSLPPYEAEMESGDEYDDKKEDRKKGINLEKKKQEEAHPRKMMLKKKKLGEDDPILTPPPSEAEMDSEDDDDDDKLEDGEIKKKNYDNDNEDDDDSDWDNSLLKEFRTKTHGECPDTQEEEVD